MAKAKKKHDDTRGIEFRVASYAIHECCSCNIYLISVLLALYIAIANCIAIATSCHSVIVVLYIIYVVTCRHLATYIASYMVTYTYANVLQMHSKGRILDNDYSSVEAVEIIVLYIFVTDTVATVCS